MFQRNKSLTSILAVIILTALMLLPTAMPAQAQTNLITVDWAADSSQDGLNTGTLGAATVTLTSTDGASNGGATFTVPWPTSLATNGVPGITTSPGVINEGSSFDWNNGTPGTVTLDFGGSTVKNPILMIVYLDPVVDTYDFADNIPITILDDNAAGVTIAPGNVVTTDGTHGDSTNEGFAIQLNGNFTSITFATNVNNAAGPQSNVLTVGAYSSDISPAAQAQEPDNALDFDGTNDYVRVPNSPVLNFNGSITLEAWIYGDAFGGRIIDKTIPNTSSGYLLDTHLSKARLIVGNPTNTICGGGGGLDVMSNATLVTGQWYHLAVVFDSSDAVAGCRVYINGVLDKAVAPDAPGFSNPAFSNTNPVNIGSDPLGGSLFNGKIDNARIWNRALRGAEIFSRFSCSSSSPVANLVASYNFNQGIGGGTNTGLTSLLDQSGNNQTGTLTNFALSGTSSNWVGSGAPITGACPGAAVGGVAELITPNAGYPVAATAGMVVMSLMLMGAGAWLMRR